MVCLFATFKALGFFWNRYLPQSITITRGEVLESWMGSPKLLQVKVTGLFEKEYDVFLDENMTQFPQ